MRSTPPLSFSLVLTRETREGRPLLTVETEAIGDLRSTNKRKPSLVGFLGNRAGTRDF